MKQNKKIISLLLVVFLLASLFVGCGKTAEKDTESTEPEAAEGLYIPGVYTGVAKGHNGDVKVEVTLDENSVVSVTILEHEESAGIADPAIERIPEAIVSGQTLNVDTISGATTTSTAIIEAVKNALEEAGADISKLTAESTDNAADSTDVKEMTTDVLIIGAGGAGLSAAVSASEQGAQVIVLEKMAAIGGNTIRSGGAFNAVDPEHQASIKMTDALRETVQDAIATEAVSEEHQKLIDDVKVKYEEHNNTNPDILFDCPEWHALQTFMSGDMKGDITLIRKLTEEALPTKQWLSEQGVEWQDEIRAVVGALWERSSQATEEKGISFIEPLETKAKENGVEILTEVTAKELIQENDRVIGVLAEGADGTQYKFTAAKGVILATGGFSANVEMRQEYNTQWSDLGDGMTTTNHPGATGDGIVMAEKVGAELVQMDYIQLMPLWPVSGGGISGYVNNVMYVNKDGERFVAEDSRRDVLAQGALDQPEKLFYIVNDQTEVDSVGVPQEQLDYMVSEKMLFRGETIEELAEAIGMDAETLKATTDKFNTAVAAQKDEFGRVVWGNPIEKGPFYASSFSPAVHHTMGGVKVDIDTHVIDTNGVIIPGLYAAGEITGGIHGTNRVGGNAIPDALVYGRISGEQVVS